MPRARKAAVAEANGHHPEQDAAQATPLTLAAAPEPISPATYWWRRGKAVKEAAERRRQTLPFADTKSRYIMRFVELGDMQAAIQSLEGLADLRERITLLNDIAPMDKGVWGGQVMAPAEDDGDEDNDDKLRKIMQQYDAASLLDQTDVPLGMVIPSAWQKTKEAEAFWAAHPDSNINLAVVFLTWYYLFRKGLKAAAAERRASTFGMAVQMSSRQGDMISGGGELP